MPELRKLVDPSLFPAEPFDNPRASSHCAASASEHPLLAGHRAVRWGRARAAAQEMRVKKAAAADDGDDDGGGAASIVAAAAAVRAPRLGRAGGGTGKQLLAFLDVHHARLFGVVEREKEKKKRASGAGSSPSRPSPWA